MSTTSTLRQHTPKSGTINSIKRNCIALINRFNNYFIKSYYECFRSDWSDDGHMSHVTSVRETVHSIQSDSLKYMKKKIWMYHIKKLNVNAVA